MTVVVWMRWLTMRADNCTAWHVELVRIAVLAFVGLLAAHSLEMCACDAAACMHA